MKSLKAIARDIVPLNKKRYHHGPNGNLVRNEAKRSSGLSARQDKKIRKFRKRWMVNNRVWFGAEEAAKVGDRRI
jgi:ribosomal protein L35